MPHIFALQVIFAGQSSQKTTGQIGRQPGYLEMKTGGILLAHIGQHGIHHISPRRGWAAFGRTGDGRTVQCFSQMDHLGNLVPDMGGLSCTLNLGQIGHGPG